MLAFTHTPDPVFHHLILLALEMMRDDVAQLDREMADYLYRSTRAIPDRTILLAQIDRITSYHTDPDYLYYLSQFHWLILHDGLDTFVEIHNDTPAHSAPDSGRLPVGKINLDELRNYYFKDLDCLILPSLVATMTHDQSGGRSGDEVLELLGDFRHTKELRALADGKLPEQGRFRVALTALEPGDHLGITRIVPPKPGSPYPEFPEH